MRYLLILLLLFNPVLADELPVEKSDDLFSVIEEMRDFYQGEASVEKSDDLILKSVGQPSAFSSFIIFDNSYKYIPLEYVSFPGSAGQVLDLPISLSTDYSYSFKFSSGRASYNNLFYDANSSFGVFSNLNSNYLTFFGSRLSVSGPLYECYYTNNIVSCNNVTSSISTTYNSDTFYLGGSWRDSSFSQYFIGDLYYFKVWDKDNNLILDLVPVMSESGDIGFYDKVNNYFYNSSAFSVPESFNQSIFLTSWNSLIYWFQYILGSWIMPYFIEWFIVVLIFTFFIKLFSFSNI